MAKLPVAGQVKTRLCPPLDGEAAAAVQGVFLRHLLDRLGRLRGIQTLVWAYAGGDRDAAQAVVRDVGMRCRGASVDAAPDERIGHPRPVTLVEQASGDLGDRLAAAANAVRPAAALFFGVDSPHVPDAHVDAAVAALARGDDVVGPCEDGGFWCLGTSADRDVAALCRGVDWSSGRELGQVRDHAVAAGRPLADAPAFWDVDRPDDLARLLADLARAPDDSPNGRLRDRLAALSLPHL